VAYWLKSGPFLAENQLRPIRGQAPNISWQLGGKTNSFDLWLKSLIPVSVNISKFMCFYKVEYYLKSGPYLAGNRSRPIRGQAPTFHGNSEETKFLRFCAKIADMGISEFKQVSSFL
jgi:hypothetical protein